VKNTYFRDDKTGEEVTLLLFLICRGSDGNLSVALTKVNDELTQGKWAFLTLSGLVPLHSLNSQSFPNTFQETVIERLKEKYTLNLNEHTLFPVNIHKDSSLLRHNELQENFETRAFLLILPPKCEPLSLKEHKGVQLVALDQLMKGSPRIEDVHRQTLQEALFQYSREIFQAKHSNLKAHPCALKVMKLPVPVKVRFAMSPGNLKTKEGSVTYTVGDALLTGVGGESWPVQRSTFDETYEPMNGTLSGSEGLYVKKPIGVWAIQLDHAEDVWIGDGENRLLGEKGDWLVEYSVGRFGVVSQDIFQKTYQILPKHSE